MSTSLSIFCTPTKKPDLLGISHYMFLIDEVSMPMETVDELPIDVAVTDNLSPAMRTKDELPIKLIS